VKFCGRTNSNAISLGGGLVVPYPAPRNETTSRIMRGNRKGDTRAELALRRLLFTQGLRYRVSYPIVCSDGTRVRPDVVFPKTRIAVFVDGCYWHSCPTHGSAPKHNPSYWSAKLARNRSRDTAQSASLRADGWQVIRAWEHEDPGKVAVLVKRAVLKARRS
jgi:DNA mismatch endonuclease, patch repair protein